MTNVRISHANIKVGNGTITMATKIGDKTITVEHKDGLTMNILLKYYQHVPHFSTNLFFFTEAL